MPLGVLHYVTQTAISEKALLTELVNVSTRQYCFHLVLPSYPLQAIHKKETLFLKFVLNAHKVLDLH